MHVVTRSAVDNGNPVGMNFLRILGLFGFNPIWNVAAEAIAVQGVSTCHNNGLIALGKVTQTNQNKFYNNICVHGGGGLMVRNDDYFQPGVAVSTTCKDCVGPDDHDPSVNEGWDEAWWRGGENEPLYPLNAAVVGEYAAALGNLHKMQDYQDMIWTYGTNYENWHYLFKPDGSAPDRKIVKTLPDTLEPNTVYHLNCKGGNERLPETPMRNLAIISTCTIKVNPNDNPDMINVAIVADFESSSPGISIAGKGSFGTRTCGGLGMFEFYTTGSDIHLAAKGDVNAVRLISAGDIDWAAKANGRIGIMAEAMGDIKMTTQAEFGLCANDTVNEPNQYTYRLVL